MSKTNSAIAGAGAGAAVGGPWGALIGGVGGYMLGSDDPSSSMLENLMKQAQAIPLPILKEYYPDLYKVVVSLNPEVETAVNLGPSEMQGISTDPKLRQAQLAALAKLQDVGNSGGRDAQFMADASQMQNDINTNIQGQQGAIMQNLATRGLSGGGSELVARSLAAQQGSNRQAQLASDLNAQAQQRALSAIMQSGQLGGQIQNQDFSQQAQKAQAADAISKFNAANQQSVLHNNVNTANNAQQWNAQNTQNNANQNTGLTNQADAYNLGLAQQQYQNKLAKYGLVSGATNSLANNLSNASQRQDQFVGGMISSGANAYAANQYNQPKQPAQQSYSNYDDYYNTKKPPASED